MYLISRIDDLRGDFIFGNLFDLSKNNNSFLAKPQSR